MGGGRGKMKIEIEIPKEFEVDYNSDRFKDFFMRVLVDTEINLNSNEYLCGLYEQETIEMFVEAFQNSIIVGG